MRSAAAFLSVLAALGAASVAAQSPLTAGATAGAVKLTDQRSEQAVTGVVQYQASPWLRVSGLSAQSALSAPHATSLRADAGYDVSSRWWASASLGADVGAADSTQALSRVVGAGAGYRLAAPFTLTLDGSIGLSAASPKWAVSIGVGTAFAGTSPVSLSSPLRRLKTTFAGGVNRGSGGGKIGCR